MRRCIFESTRNQNIKSGQHNECRRAGKNEQIRLSLSRRFRSMRLATPASYGLQTSKNYILRDGF